MTVLDSDVFQYLDELRELGVTNMFGAVPYLEREFSVDRKIGQQLLSDWMATFEQRNGGTQ